jgi:hypothetical protein
MILSPGYRTKFLEVRTPHKVAALTASFKAHYYARYHNTTRERGAEEVSGNEPMSSSEDSDQEFITGGRVFYHTPKDIDEVSVYLEEAPTKGVRDPLAWWKFQSWRFPQLS